MKLFLLRNIEKSKLWEPWYDKAFGFVVSAETPKEAREVASKQCGNEGEEAWINDENSTCIELKPSKKKQVIIRDFAAA